MQKHVNLVDLVKSFPTNIYLQNLASIHKRTSPVKFAHLAEKSEKGSISNFSTKVSTREGAARRIQKNWRSYKKQDGLSKMKSIFGGLGFSDIVKAAMQKEVEPRDGVDLGEPSRYAGKWRHKVKAAGGFGLKLS